MSKSTWNENKKTLTRLSSVIKAQDRGDVGRGTVAKV